MFRNFIRVSPIVRPFSTTSLRLQNSQFYDDFGIVLKNDLKKAMLAKDNVRKETVKMLRSELKNYQIDTKNKENNEFAIFKVVSKMMKTREKSIEEYTAVKRKDLVANEQNQLDCLREYLDQVPVASEAEIDNKITDFLNAKKAELADGSKLPPAPALLKELDFESLEKEWKASSKDIRKSLFTVYKKLFG